MDCTCVSKMLCAQVRSLKYALNVDCNVNSALQSSVEQSKPPTICTIGPKWHLGLVLKCEDLRRTLTHAAQVNVTLASSMFAPGPVGHASCLISAMSHTACDTTVNSGGRIFARQISSIHLAALCFILSMLAAIVASRLRLES